MLILIYISSPGPHLRLIQENSDTFQGQPLHGDINGVESQIHQVLGALADAVLRRFSDVDVGVVQSTKLADLQSWPAEDPGGELTEFLTL